ncbi:MAG: molecular chaperone [Gammaproteobacteria bacterium]|nr:molecular chaperone [Gammaproteobacteria bacterium]
MNNYCGIDFGTSNCTAGWLAGDEPQLASLDGNSPYLSSALYIQRRKADANDHDHDSDEPYLNESLSRLLAQGAKVFLGNAAHEHYSADPLAGVFIRSPKSMLGSRLTPAQSQIYRQISTLLLQEIKQKAEQQKDPSGATSLDFAVLGRPVHFQGIDGAMGDERAEAILRQAAAEVGFKEIQFAYEPVAAAMEFERSLTKEQLALVVDIGGGTSDISFIRLDPKRMTQLDRSADLLGHAGRRIGGVDMDIKLAIYSLMPLLGRGSAAVTGRPLPNSLFSDAVNIIDIQAQENFYRPQTSAEIQQLLQQAQEPAKVARLQQLYEQHLSYYLVQAAEQAKISLAQQHEVEVSLSRVEASLSQLINNMQLDQAIYQELNGIQKLISHSLASAGSKPDCIFLTGGASAAKGIQALLKTMLPDVPLVFGDRFGSVGKGLCSIAARTFR